MTVSSKFSNFCAVSATYKSIQHAWLSCKEKEDSAERGIMEAGFFNVRLIVDSIVERSMKSLCSQGHMDLSVDLKVQCLKILQ